MGKDIRRRIAVVGLGYVGLPIAVAFGKLVPVVGFDIDEEKVGELRRGIDRTGEVSAADLQAAQVQFTCQSADLKTADFGKHFPRHAPCPGKSSLFRNRPVFVSAPAPGASHGHARNFLRGQQNLQMFRLSARQPRPLPRSNLRRRS